jgi:hypothetical protein
MNHEPCENDPSSDIASTDTNMTENGNKRYDTETLRASLHARIGTLTDAQVRALWEFLAVLRLLLCCLAGLAVE